MASKPKFKNLKSNSLNKGKMPEKEERTLDFLLVIFLFAITLITRIPFKTSFLFAWDSGTVALGTQHYDLIAHEPHPPGYVLYVLLAKIINYFIGDINLVLVAISIMSAAGAAIFLYLLGKEMYGRRTGIIAATIFIFSKVFWANSLIAMSYTLQCFLALVIVYLGYKFIKNPTKLSYLYGGSIALAIAGGFRQDLLFFMLPLWLYVTIKYGRKYFIKTWALIVGICAVWFLGMIAWTGGLKNYFVSLFSQTQYVAGFSVRERGASGLSANYRLTLSFLYDSMKGNSLLILFVGYLFSPKKIKADARLQILLLWILPALLFYVLVHIGERGYLLTFLPAFFLILGRGLVWLAHETCEVLKLHKIINYAGLIAICILLSAWNGYFFLRNDDFLSLSYIRKQDQLMEEKIELMSKSKPGEINFIDEENFKQLHYYLPDHNVYPKAEEIPADGKPVRDLTTK